MATSYLFEANTIIKKNYNELVLTTRKDLIFAKKQNLLNMSKIIVWHNPRCRKSREGLAAAEKTAKEKGLNLEIRKYLDNPPTEQELKKVLQWLGIKPIELVRTKETVWKENFKGKEMTDEQIIKAMVQYPKLIERPVVIYNDKAVLARPADKVLELFS